MPEINTDDLATIRAEAKAIKRGKGRDDEDTTIKVMGVSIATLAAIVGFLYHFFPKDTDFVRLETKAQFLEQRLERLEDRLDSQDVLLKAVERNVYQMARKARGVRAVRPEDLNE